MCLIPISTASADSQNLDNELKVEYDGNVKILSNIENYLSNNNSIQTRSSSNGNLYNVFSQLGYANDINNLDEDFIDSVKNAKKIYILSQTFIFDDEDIITYNPVSISRKNCTVTLNVIDEGKLLNGRNTFKLISTVKWDDSHPTWRMKDLLVFAWTDNVLGVGSEHTHFYMQYDKSVYNSQGIWEKTIRNERASSSKISEIYKFNGAGIKYDLPENKTFLVFPKYTYENIFLYASTRVTATNDFIAYANYGHQILAGTPTFSINANGSMEAAISFNYVLDEFYPGSIRVYVNN